MYATKQRKDHWRKFWDKIILISKKYTDNKLQLGKEYKTVRRVKKGNRVGSLG